MVVNLARSFSDTTVIAPGVVSRSGRALPDSTREKERKWICFVPDWSRDRLDFRTLIRARNKRDPASSGEGGGV